MKKNHALFVTTSSVDSNAPATRGVAVSSTTAYYSKKISGSAQLMLQFSWTGTPTGAFVIQGSDRDQPVESTDADWYPITPDDVPTDPAGSATGTFARVNSWNSKWKRVKYTNASGSGVLYGDASVGEQY